jgi:hypothetical protein
MASSREIDQDGHDDHGSQLWQVFVQQQPLLYPSHQFVNTVPPVMPGPLQNLCNVQWPSVRLKGIPIALSVFSRPTDRQEANL